MHFFAILKVEGKFDLHIACVSSISPVSYDLNGKRIIAYNKNANPASGLDFILSQL